MRLLLRIEMVHWQIVVCESANVPHLPNKRYLHIGPSLGICQSAKHKLGNAYLAWPGLGPEARLGLTWASPGPRLLLWGSASLPSTIAWSCYSVASKSDHARSAKATLGNALRVTLAAIMAGSAYVANAIFIHVNSLQVQTH